MKHDARRAVGREQYERDDEEEAAARRAGDEPSGWGTLSTKMEAGRLAGIHEIELEKHVGMNLSLGERLIGRGRAEGREAVEVVLSSRTEL